MILFVRNGTGGSLRVFAGGAPGMGTINRGWGAGGLGFGRNGGRHRPLLQGEF